MSQQDRTSSRPSSSSPRGSLPLNVTALDQVMTYGGTVPTLTYASDITPLDTPPTCTTSANSTSPIGTYTITCSGAAMDGYEITYVPGTLTVDSAPLTITARDGTKTYGMTLVWVLDVLDPGSYITVDGLRNADTVTGITLTTDGAPANATLGTYPIAPGAVVGTGLTDYDTTYVAGTLAVTAAAGALIVTPDSQVMTYGGAMPALTYTVAGLQDGQTLDTGATCIVPDMVAPPVGTHPIGCAGAAKTGYQIAYGSATLTVNPAPLTIIADNKSMGLGSTVPLLTASYFGLVNGDTPAEVGGTVALTTTATSSSPVGTYGITFASAPALPDYTVTTVPATLTVNPELLTFNNNYLVTGDFAVGWVFSQGTGRRNRFRHGRDQHPERRPVRSCQYRTRRRRHRGRVPLLAGGGMERVRAPGEGLLPRLHDHRGATGERPALHAGPRAPAAVVALYTRSSGCTALTCCPTCRWMRMAGACRPDRTR